MVQNDPFTLVTCDLSNYNGGTKFMYKQWAGSTTKSSAESHRKEQATALARHRKRARQFLKAQGSSWLVFLRPK